MSLAEKILVIAPEENTQKLFERVVEEMNLDIEIDIFISTPEEYGRSNIINKIGRMLKSGREIIITRGTTAAEVKNLINATVVEIEITELALLKALSTYQKKNIPVAVVECKDFLAEARRVARYLEMEIEEYEVKTIDDFKRQFQSAYERGIRCAIGGAWGLYHTGYLRTLGISYTYVETTKDSIKKSLENAKLLYEVRREEKRQKDLMEAINNFSVSGIITIDENGRIVVANPAALKVLGLRETDVLEKNWRTVFPSWEFDRVFDLKQTLLNRFQKNDALELIINYVPLFVEGEIAGAVANFQQVNDLEDAANRVRYKKSEKQLKSGYTFDSIIGESRIIRQNKDFAKMFCLTDSTVLIQGETGTGKELFAGAIHNASSRKNEPFVAINCSAFPSSLLESELFGYVDGAFTGARKGGKRGIFELAHKGTLFLDEIGEIPPEIQVRLLRVLQEKEIMRLGDDRIIPVDVRIIAATNKDLHKEMVEGNFRADLFFRLSVLNMSLPPLRKRLEDIPLLVSHLTERINRRLDCQVQGFDDEIMKFFCSYFWPGNVREVQNIIESMIAVTREGVVHYGEVEYLIAELKRRESITMNKIRITMEDWERDAIVDALVHEDGNRSRAAVRLGIDRSTLIRKMHRYGL